MHDMAERKPKSQQITGTNLEQRTVTLSVSQPSQLTFFQTFFPENDKYSNSIELYDAIPKIFASPKSIDAMRINERFLDTVERKFRYKPCGHQTNQNYSLELRPARVAGNDGAEREYFLTKREELVEAALRKLACNPKNGVFLNDSAGVQFTLYELRKELARHNHSIHYYSLIEALKISHRIGMSLKTMDGKSVMEAPVYPVLVISSRENWLSNPKSAKCYVQFNPLLTHGINQLTYRQIDYDKSMSFKSLLARWLFSKLSHNYTQASHKSPYRIKASSIVRDCHLINNSRFRDKLDAINSANAELIGTRVIASIKKENKLEKNKIVDVIYTFHPTVEFIDEAVKANKRTQKLRLNSLIE